MPKRDDGDWQDIPGLRAERAGGSAAPAGKARSGRTGTHAAVDGHDSSLGRALLVVALCLGFAVGVWAFVLHQQLSQAKTELADADRRLSELENRLSTADQGWNQSSVALQVRLKELMEKNDKMLAEVDKLWASAWRRNQKDIGDQNEALKKLDTLLKQQTKTVEEIRLQAQAINQKASQLEQIGNTRQKALDDAVARLNKLAGEQAELAKRLKASDEWEASVNAFRRQTNQTLESLRQSMDSLARQSRAAPASTATQLP